jgi:Protein of unknown function (DUF3224)
MCLPDVAHILPKNPRSDNSSFRMRLGDLIAIIGRQLHTFWAVIEIALRELRRLGSADDARDEARGDAAETAAMMCRKRRGSAVLRPFGYIVPGSGTGDLRGLRGEAGISVTAAGMHTLTLDYDFAEWCRTSPTGVVSLCSPDLGLV